MCVLAGRCERPAMTFRPRSWTINPAGTKLPRQISSARSDSTSSIASTRAASHLSLQRFLSFAVTCIRCRPVALEQRVARLPVPMGLDKAGKVQKCGGKIFAAAFVWGGDQPPKFSDEALGRLNGIGTCTGA